MKVRPGQIDGAESLEVGREGSMEVERSVKGGGASL